MVEEFLVELIRHVVAEAAELLVERGDGDHARGVAARADGNFHMDDLLAKDLLGFLLEPDAVHLVEVSLRLEGDDEVESLVRAD
jgi:hypothetical protein